jgi:hypothetical protein
MYQKQGSADCRMTGVVPYFLVDDVFATAEFYRDVLGFTFDEFLVSRRASPLSSATTSASCSGR